MICNTLFLHSKEEWFITIGSRLQEAQPDYNKGQDATTSTWRSDRQIREGEIFQQA